MAGSAEDYRDQVKTCLIDDYVVGEVEADRLLRDHHAKVQKGWEQKSNAYYVADRIADAEELEYREGTVEETEELNPED